MHPEGPAADLGLTDGRLGAVLLVPDLPDQVVGQLVVVADLQLRALGPQVGLIPGLRPVGVVADLGGAVSYTHLDVYKRQSYHCNQQSHN